MGQAKHRSSEIAKLKAANQNPASGMTDPYIAMQSFQQCLHNGVVQLQPVNGQDDMCSFVDVPLPGKFRMTYVRLDPTRRIVTAFLTSSPNGFFEGFPCISLGYAVPETYRKQGFAKQLLKDAIEELRRFFATNGAGTIFVEAIIDKTNLASQHVAESIFGVERESIVDEVCGIPAYRYTKRFDSKIV